MTTTKSARTLAGRVFTILTRLLLLMVMAFITGYLGLLVTFLSGANSLDPVVMAATIVPLALISAGWAWAFGLWREGWVTRIVAAAICLIFPAFQGGPGVLFFACLIFRECL